MSDRLPFRATKLGARYDGLEKLPASILLDNVRSLYNVGSFFRTADGCRLERLYLCGITGHPPDHQLSKTALGAEESVPWIYAKEPIPVLEALRASGHELAAIETSPHAVDLFDWQPRFPVCVLFGHETDGLRPEVAERCDVHVRIPMLGAKYSLNVATAGGIVMYELLRKFTAQSQGPKGAGNSAILTP